jgi:cold shock CspA family protein
MERGVIRMFNQDAGYGFITDADGRYEDGVFFHRRQCREYLPAAGDPVEFSLQIDPTGRPRAGSVRLAMAPMVER